MMNKSVLSSNEILYIDTLVKRKHSNIRGISILQDGDIIFEKYYGRKTSEDKFNVASVTKSVISLLIGIAIDKGFINSIDDKVMDYFDEYTFLDNNTVRDQVTIKNLLTMTAPFPFPNMKEPLVRICRQKDWVKYALEIMGQGGRIGTFKYSTTGAHILSAILTKVTHKSAREFANETLFEPLGMDIISDYPMTFDLDHVFGSKMRGWVSDPLGNSAGGWGLTLSLKDMSKLGQLCLQEGRIHHRQVVSREWLKASSIPIKNSYGYYGYLWWISENNDAYMATGSGGNIIYINKERRIVISIAATIVSKHVDRQKFIAEILDLL